MNQDLTNGPVMGSILRFAVPMILGDLLQQCYNVADTLIVGRYLGKNALAAVGSSFTLMTFLTSILLGLSMGSSAVFSIRFGQRDEDGLREGVHASFALIAVLTLVLNAVAFACLDYIRVFLRVPDEVWGMMRAYLIVIFCGIAATFLYNYFSSFLRAVGNSVIPLVFLAVSSALNIVLDLWFVLGLERGVTGAAEATVIAQYVSGLSITVYSLAKHPELRPQRNFRVRWACVKEIACFSILTYVQQSVMNLGILMVQGLVNSFGSTVMAAFAAAVKIDAFAYMPVQDFGNAFSTFIAQNYGARQEERIRRGLGGAVLASTVFCVVVSTVVWILAGPLMGLPSVLETCDEKDEYEFLWCLMSLYRKKDQQNRVMRIQRRLLELLPGMAYNKYFELLVLPAYQKQGIGSQLLRLAKENTPTMLYFGAQPGVEIFYEKNGCEKGLQSYVIPKKRHGN